MLEGTVQGLFNMMSTMGMLKSHLDHRHVALLLTTPEDKLVREFNTLPCICLSESFDY